MAEFCDVFGALDKCFSCLTLLLAWCHTLNEDVNIHFML